MQTPLCPAQSPDVLHGPRADNPQAPELSFLLEHLHNEQGSHPSSGNRVHSRGPQ